MVKESRSHDIGEHLVTLDHAPRSTQSIHSAPSPPHTEAPPTYCRTRVLLAVHTTNNSHEALAFSRQVQKNKSTQREVVVALSHATPSRAPKNRHRPPLSHQRDSRCRAGAARTAMPPWPPETPAAAPPPRRPPRRRAVLPRGGWSAWPPSARGSQAVGSARRESCERRPNTHTHTHGTRVCQEGTRIQVSNPMLCPPPKIFTFWFM